MAVVTSLDADHLDIYGDQATMVEAYNDFCSKIRKGGILIVNSKIRKEIIVPEGVNVLHTDLIQIPITWLLTLSIRKIITDSILKHPSGIIEDLHFAFPGIINIENFTAAIAIAINVRCY